VAGLTYGLSQAPGTGGLGDAHPLGPVAAGLVLPGVFTGHSLRRGARSLIGVRLFANRDFAAASACLLLMGAALFGALILLPLYYQVVRGQDALGAGLLLVPRGVGVAIAMPLAGRPTDRRGARAVVLPGVALAVTGTLACTQVTAHTPYLLLAGALARYPGGDRYLAHLQVQSGYQVRPDLPGLDGTEVECLYERGAAWLAGQLVAP
jgi:predicted MFS family arabinose efflux permease